MFTLRGGRDSFVMRANVAVALMATALGVPLFSTYSPLGAVSRAGGGYVRHPYPMSGRGSRRSDRAQHRNNRSQVVAEYAVRVAMPAVQESASVETEGRLGRKDTSRRCAPGVALSPIQTKADPVLFLEFQHVVARD
jgi:hypothetical protein